MRTLAIGALALLVVSTGFAQDTATEPKLSGSALIDHWIKAKWTDANLKPAAKASDAEFLRRVFLDVVGQIPALDEAEKFLKDTNSRKREALVDSLVKDDRYGEHWADVWSGIIVGFDKENRAQGYRNEGAHDLRDMFEKNLPYDEFARKIITVEGFVPEGRGAMMMKPDEKAEDEKPVGLASYLVRQFREAGKDFPKALAGKLTRAFMGVQIQCAQCHDHPFDKWTQEEFYGMASFFTEVRVRRDQKDQQLRGYHVEEQQRGPVGKRMGDGGPNLAIPDSKSGPIKPSFIETGKGAETGVSRRTTYAKYVTSPDNLQFAKMCVNRYWSHFFGTGIVNPVDDFNGKNKPSHPELLTELSKDFIAHKYDLHWLIKAITSSEAYALTSRASAKERDPQAEKLFALGRVRALAPEQILRSVIEAANLDEGPMMSGRGPMGKGPGAPGKPGKKGMAGKGENAQRMIMMLTSQFRNTFEDDEGSESVEFAGTITSALMMMNHPLLASGSTDRRMNGFGEMLSQHPSPESKVKAIFLSCLTRQPTGSELSRWMAHCTKAQGNQGYEDLMWTLLNTSEFLFNH